MITQSALFSAQKKQSSVQYIAENIPILNQISFKFLQQKKPKLTKSELINRRFKHLPSMVELKALKAFDPKTRSLLQPLSCLVDVVTQQDSEKSSLLNYVDTSNLN